MDNLIDYLPQVFKDIKEFQAICSTVSIQHDLALQALEGVFYDQFILTATENGVKRWEALLGIDPKATNTLADRKFRVLSRINSKIPYTLMGLKEQLAVLCGEDGYSLVVENDQYKVIARIALHQIEQYAEANDLLNRQLPANMLIDISVIYNMHEALNELTHSQLSAYTHKQLKEEVIS